MLGCCAAQSLDTWLALVCFMREFWDLNITTAPANADAEALAYYKEAMSPDAITLVRA